MLLIDIFKYTNTKNDIFYQTVVPCGVLGCSVVPYTKAIIQTLEITEKNRIKKKKRKKNDKFRRIHLW